MEDVGRVVVTSTISAVGTADGRPADEENPYPEEGLGLVYADAKRAGEREAIAAGERLGVEVVVVNPAYVLGVPVDTSQPGETSTRIVGNYLRGRLPAVLNASINFVDVEDVATGHLLAAERGLPGERYILGGHNRPWAELIDMVAQASGIHHPLLVIPVGGRPDRRPARTPRAPRRHLGRGVRADGPGLALHLRQGQAGARLPPAPAGADRHGDGRVVPRADPATARSTARSARGCRPSPRVSARSAGSGSCGRCARLRSCCAGGCSQAAEEVGTDGAVVLAGTRDHTIAGRDDRGQLRPRGRGLPDRDALVVPPPGRAADLPRAGRERRPHRGRDRRARPRQGRPRSASGRRTARSGSTSSSPPRSSGSSSSTSTPPTARPSSRYALRQSGCKALFAAPRSRPRTTARWSRRSATTCPTSSTCVFFGDEAHELLRDARRRGRVAELDFDEPINIQYTSGTTGSPKGATLSHHNILNNGFFVGEFCRYTEEDRVCIPVPFYHCFGMVMGNLGCVTHGACMVIPAPSFEPRATLAAVAEERCTSLYGVPTMFIAELEHPDFDSFDLSSLRTGIMAGSPCPERGHAQGHRPHAHGGRDDLLRHDRDLAGLDPDDRRRRARAPRRHRRPRAPARRGQDRRPGDRAHRASAAIRASCARAATR